MGQCLVDEIQLQYFLRRWLRGPDVLIDVSLYLNAWLWSLPFIVHA